MYHPRPDIERSYDAIYNAQLAPFKRHYLARTIPSCAYITKLFSHFPAEHKRASIAKFLGELPRGHTVLNDIADGDVRLMDHLQVNRALAGAHVGLCLSKVEGAMYASAEYLLAGLPVVSTPSAGGRDAFFHPDTCLIVDAPRAVQDGVAAMKAPNLPPDYVRSVTIGFIDQQRDAFNRFIDALRGRAAQTSDRRWSFAYHHKLSQFGSLSDFDASSPMSAAPIRLAPRAGGRATERRTVRR
ncbi:glycosyltransferase [Methylorubrum aminovorans]